MAALIYLSPNKTRIRRQEILDIRQVVALNFATFGGVLHMCVVVVRVSLMFVHNVREKVMFEMCGGESESMSDQYGSVFCF